MNPVVTHARWTLTVLVLLSASPLVLGHEDGPTPTHFLRGRIVLEDESPASNATISLVSAESDASALARSGADGQYELRVKPGVYRADFSFPNYTYERRYVAIAADLTEDVVLVPGPALRDIQVRIIDGDAGGPVGGAVLRFTGPRYLEAALRSVYVSNESGLVNAQVPADGAVWAVSKPFYLTTTGNLSASEGELTVLLHGDPGTVLRTFSVAADVPPSNVVVLKNGTPLATAMASGSVFRARVPESGTDEVLLSWSNGLQFKSGLRDPPVVRVPLGDLELNTFVTSDDGRLLAGAVVILQNAEGDAQVRTDNEGRARLSLVPGRYHIWATAEGRNATNQVVELSSPMTVTLALAIEDNDAGTVESVAVHDRSAVPAATGLGVVVAFLVGAAVRRVDR